LWESGNPAFGFPLSHGGRGWNCGNVEIETAISTGSWAAMANLVLVFLAVHNPAFPQPFCGHAALLFAKLPNSFLFAACILMAAPRTQLLRCLYGGQLTVAAIQALIRVYPIHPSQGLDVAFLPLTRQKCLSREPTQPLTKSSTPSPRNGCYSQAGKRICR
jgi:hypothetical protein